MVEQLDKIEVALVLERIEPIITYSLQQTAKENRDDLKQHLYEVAIKTLKNTEFSKPKGLFNE